MGKKLNWNQDVLEVSFGSVLPLNEPHRSRAVHPGPKIEKKWFVGGGQCTVLEMNSFAISVQLVGWLERSRTCLCYDTVNRVFAESWGTMLDNGSINASQQWGNWGSGVFCGSVASATLYSNTAAVSKGVCFLLGPSWGYITRDSGINSNAEPGGITRLPCSWWK